MMVRIYTSGVFDLFHAGHLEALQKAKALGDYLLVGVATDEDAASYKRTPVIPYAQRCQILASINSVDAVICGPLYPTEAFYQTWRIDIHCQDADQQDFYVTAKRLGIIRFVGRSPAAETSNIIRRILTDYGSPDA
jgi:cytidyltransferase-like protein